MDPYIDGIVPIPMSQKERDFLTASPFLVGNLRRVYAAYDEDGNDLSAWPARAADAIEAGTRTLQKLGARLAELLDEDQWAECEALLQAAGVTPNAELTGAEQAQLAERPR